MFNLFNKKKKNKTKSNLFSFVLLKRRINPKKLLIISIFALIIVTISIFSAYSFPGSSGGVVVDDAHQIVISFTNTGEHNWLVPSGVTSVDVLVVAGGGGAGSANAGGGGAGGVIFEENYQVNPGDNINIFVGEGGGPGLANTYPAENGQNSFFSDLIAIGGGAGASRNCQWPAGDGGSGGGAARDNVVGGSGLVGQGYNGGSNPGGRGSGGGGSGSAGSNVINPGNGLYFGNIFGEEYGENGWFGGGGAGAENDYGDRTAGGIGGGGTGLCQRAWTERGCDGGPPHIAPIPNTGGGAGGNSQDHGASGIILIRYKVDSKLQVSSLNSGLVGYWSLSESDYNSTNNRVSDLTPYSNHGTNLGANFTSDRFGIDNNAMKFDGNNEYINLDETDILDFQPTDSFSFGGWFLIENAYPRWFSWTNPPAWLNTTAGIFGRGRIANHIGINISAIWQDTGSVEIEPNLIGVRFQTGRRSGHGVMYTSPYINLNEYYHIYFVYTPGIQYTYINGQLVDSRNNSSFLNDPTPISGDWRIFHYDTLHGGNPRSIIGKANDVRIYNRALSSQEINQLYNLYQPKITSNLHFRYAPYFK